jgi:hypothetical protein
MKVFNEALYILSRFGVSIEGFLANKVTLEEQLSGKRNLSLMLTS